MSFMNNIPIKGELFILIHIYMYSIYKKSKIGFDGLCMPSVRGFLFVLTYHWELRKSKKA